MNLYYNKFVSNGRAVVIGEWGSLDKNNTSALYYTFGLCC